MKTLDEILDEVAFEHIVVSSFPYALHSYSRGGEYQETIIKIVKEAMLRYSKEACEEQKKLCADVAKMTCDGDPDMLDGHRCNYGEYVINKQSILNAKSPIE